MEYKYADGRTEIKYVWNRYKGVNFVRSPRKKWVGEDIDKILDNFKKKYPNKVVYAPRPYQDGWMYVIDLRDVKKVAERKLKFPIGARGMVYTTPDEIMEDVADPYYPVLALESIPLARRDLAEISWNYIQNGTTKGGKWGDFDIREYPYFNMYLEDYLMNYPRKYPYDHTRFAYYCKDYSKIPQLYREPMLRLADLGIITPEQSPLKISEYYFKPAKVLTRGEATTMITRVFDRTKRDVLDEVTVNADSYWVPKRDFEMGKAYLYHSTTTKKFGEYRGDEFEQGIVPAQQRMTVRIQELKAMSFAKAAVKAHPEGYYAWYLVTKQGASGFVYSATFFTITSGWGGVLMYDEADMTGLSPPLSEVPKCLPVAYRGQFWQDCNKYYNKYGYKKNDKTNLSVTVQYGDVFVHFNNIFGNTRILIFPANPVYLTKKLIVARPDPKYVETNPKR